MIRFGGRLLGCLGVVCLFVAVAAFGAGEAKRPVGITVGEPAPDFELPKLVITRDADGKPIGKISNEKIKLSSFFGKKPVCMIMSSYT